MNGKKYRRMNPILLPCIALCLQFATAVSAAPQGASYAGQQGRDIKALSAEDVDAYLSGKGYGFAKAAELNGYPGPAHVLELASEIKLTSEQRAKTEALFASMQQQAIEVGRALVEAERKLDSLFASRAINPSLLESSLGDIGALQAKVRAVHLEAHLAQEQILTPEQTARYAELRGYSTDGDHAKHKRHDQQH